MMISDKCLLFGPPCRLYENVQLLTLNIMRWSVALPQEIQAGIYFTLLSMAPVPFLINKATVVNWRSFSYYFGSSLLNDCS